MRLVVALLFIPSLVAAQEPASLTLVRSVERSAFSVAAGFDALWAFGDSRLARVDPASGAVNEVPLPVDPGLVMIERGLAVGEGAVWVPDTVSSTIFRIDPVSLQVNAIPTDIFGGRGSIGVGHGSVWVVTFASHDRTLARLDAAIGTVIAEIQLPSPGGAVVVLGDRVWVTSSSNAEAYRIDPATDAIDLTVPLHGSGFVAIGGFGSLWILYGEEGKVERLDGFTGARLALIETGARDVESDGGLAVGSDAIWVINRFGLIAGIEPTANSPTGLFRAPDGLLVGRRIAELDGLLWVAGPSLSGFARP
jgi:virginiamycin B lyase